VNCGQMVATGRALSSQDPSNRQLEGAKEGASSSVSLGKRDAAAIGKLTAAGVPNDLDWLVPQGLIQYESMAPPGETAQVHPYLFTTSMAKLAEEGGAKIILGMATEILKGDGDGGVKSVIYKDKQTGETRTISATDVIVSAGPWTRSVIPEAPISAIRAHSVVIRPTRPVSAFTLFTNISLPAGFGSSKRPNPTVVNPEIYARPDSTVYACGEGDHVVPLPDTSADVQVDQSRCQDIIDSVGSISDELRGGEVTARQACYLPNVDTPRGGGPLIGHAGVKGLYLATGHTCWGIQNAPGTGKLISEFVFEGQAKSAKIAALDPRKFL
jgi:glycine/D-amino acid oxidase-like deaminating enzyme